MAIRILLADDSRAVLISVRALLEQHGLDVVGEAIDGQQALDLALSLRPDIAILDHAMPGMSGLEAARAILAVTSGIRLLFLTQHRDEHLIIEAFRLGIRGYVAKSDTAEDLTRAVREVSRGRIYLSPGICAAVMEPYLPPTDALPPLQA